MKTVYREHIPLESDHLRKNIAGANAKNTCFA